MSTINGSSPDKWAYETSVRLRNAAAAVEARDWVVAVAILNELTIDIEIAERHVADQATSDGVSLVALGRAIGVTQSGAWRRYKQPARRRVRARATLGIDEQ